MYQLPKDLLFEAMDIAEIDEEGFRDDYPSRDARSGKCVGIKVNGDIDIMKLMVALGLECDKGGSEYDAVMRMANNTRSNAMGVGAIYYWPHLELTE